MVRSAVSSFDEVLASPEWAFTVAAALEQQLADDRILTVGTARASVADVIGGEPSRTAAMSFTTGDGQWGSIALVALSAFAAALEAAASDEILLTSCAGALEAAGRTISEQAVTDIETEPAYETDPGAGSDEPADGDLAVFPLLDGTALLGCLVLRVGSTRGATTGAPATPADDGPANVAPATRGASAAPYVLADVEMGVTAELGRCRMTVRELLSITPGAVIDLDRAAGAPVDVLVNGTLIARGEVVVIDEEFGIRISELVPQPAAAR